MPTPTYDLIASNVLSSSASSVTFSSIPATYRDLVLVCTMISSTGNAFIDLRLNSDSGNNYPRVWMSGDGSSATSLTQSLGSDIRLNSGAWGSSTEAVLVVANIMDYSATDKHKTIISRANRAAVGVNAQAARWANTAAVTTITLNAGTNNFGSTSSFHLYGIAS